MLSLEKEDDVSAGFFISTFQMAYLSSELSNGFLKLNANQRSMSSQDTDMTAGHLKNEKTK